jgi:hypothetical protein
VAFIKAVRRGEKTTWLVRVRVFARLDRKTSQISEKKTRRVRVQVLASLEKSRRDCVFDRWIKVEAY